jgi:hypothetical protein
MQGSQKKMHAINLRNKLDVKAQVFLLYLLFIIILCVYLTILQILLGMGE